MFGYEITEIISEDGKITEKIVNEFKVPESYIAIIVIIIFIIMSPMIRKAKVGPVEFELGESIAPVSSTAPTVSITVGR